MNAETKTISAAAKKELALQADRHLKTPQSLIHIKHTISLFQYKLWILLLHEFKRQFDANEPTDDKGFRYVSISYLEQYLGYAPSRQDLLDDLRMLRKEEICFNYLEKDGYKAQYFSGFISEVKATRLTIGFKFPSILHDVMLGIDDAKAIFQLLNWRVFNHFSGKYEAIIYKLCKDYLGVGRTPYMTINEFRGYMGLKDTEYALFEDLNKRCLKQPVNAINNSEISDILVDVIYNRKGRKVEGICFLVRPKQQGLDDVPPYKMNPAFICTKVTIPMVEQDEYLAQYSEEQIRLCIDRANEYCEDLERKNKKVNYGAIYKTAISENWAKDLLEKKAKPVKREEKVTTPVQEPLFAEPEVMDQPKMVLKQFKALSSEEQTQRIESYLKTLKGLKKAQLTADYAGLKLAIIENNNFLLEFMPYLMKNGFGADLV